MERIPKDWKENRYKEEEANAIFLKSLKQEKGVDEAAQQLHEEVFNEVDCLGCANCCKTTPPVVTKKDIKRIAKHLGITPKAFIRKYVIDDLTGDLVLSTVPCVFLEPDNACSIYEVRPTACAGYPFTDVDHFTRRTYLHTANTIVCPATFEIVKRLKEKFDNYDI